MICAPISASAGQHALDVPCVPTGMKMRGVDHAVVADQTAAAGQALGVQQLEREHRGIVAAVRVLQRTTDYDARLMNGPRTRHQPDRTASCGAPGAERRARTAGRPLATPTRRLAAMAIDLLLVAMISSAANAWFLAAGAFAAWGLTRRRDGVQRPRPRWLAPVVTTLLLVGAVDAWRLRVAQPETPRARRGGSGPHRVTRACHDRFGSRDSRVVTRARRGRVAGCQRGGLGSDGCPCEDAGGRGEAPARSGARLANRRPSG